MKEKSYKIKVSVSLDEDIIEEIKILAEQDDRNFSSYINKILKEQGWKVIRLWGKDIQKNLDKCVNKIEKEIGVQ